MDVQYINVDHLVNGADKFGIVAVIAVPSNEIKRNSIFNLLINDIHCQF